MDTRARNENGSSHLGGGMAGALATGAMTGVMVAAQRTGVLGRMPPDRITRRLLRRMGVRATRGRRGSVFTALSHLAFGMAAGSLYERFARRLRHGRLSVGTGLAFGAAVWAASYAGWVPRLGLMPPPHRDRPGRQPTLLLAHLVYGAVLALLTHPRRV